MTGRVALMCVVLAGCPDDEPPSGDGCSAPIEAARVMEPGTAEGEVVLGELVPIADSLRAEFVPYDDGGPALVREGPQGAVICMITPTICARASWLDEPEECLRVSWTNEPLEPTATGGPLDEEPTLLDVFRPLETPDGTMHCAQTVWDAFAACGLGPIRMRVSAEIRDVDDHHAVGSSEVVLTY